LRKKGALMQSANVSHGKTKMNKMVKRGELPCVHRLRSLYRERVGLGAMPMSMERKKVMKKQRKDQVGKSDSL
jgi:hypothetical protein